MTDEVLEDDYNVSRDDLSSINRIYVSFNIFVAETIF